METYVEQVLSDSTIKRFTLESGVLRMDLVLYTEKEIAIEFTECYSCVAKYGWDSASSIEGMKIASSGDLLFKTIESLNDDEEPSDGLRSFQLVSYDGSVVLEIVARQIRVGEEDVGTPIEER